MKYHGEKLRVTHNLSPLKFTQGSGLRSLEETNKLAQCFKLVRMKYGLHIWHLLLLTSPEVVYPSIEF